MPSRSNFSFSVKLTVAAWGPVRTRAEQFEPFAGFSNYKSCIGERLICYTPSTRICWELGGAARGEESGTVGMDS